MKILVTIITLLFVSGCQYYHGKVGDIEMTSTRFLMYDSKKGLTLTVTDPNTGNIVTLGLNEGIQYPDPNAVEAIVKGAVSGALGIK
jgi:hypothetical protein